MPSFESALNIHCLKNYSFEKKDALPCKDPSLPAKMYRLKNEFDLFGPRRSVEAVMLCHQNNMIHVLLMRWPPNRFLLPGGELISDETEEEALKRCISSFLGFESIVSESNDDNSSQIDALNSCSSNQWKIIDIVANWWRPNFEAEQYPYIPAHISVPKELTRIFLLAMPERARFQVPKNYDIVAVPLFEIYSNSDSYGQIISCLPQVLSRFNFNLL
ncbi:hypothetical protein SSS_00442 [Sarcoptes scabiei]|uniref:Cleavage and polyadenylation specificity factor subunit 5 n=1 Tax=Sarcoptes scabiei TaxID=52283 RepID=A0A834R7G7_SARSC|nr:hypothetical protein SSS_00442 [Sarcoptes scabiei]